MKWYLLNNKKYKLSNFDMNPNRMFKQPKEVAEKQLKDPKVTIIVAFIAMVVISILVLEGGNWSQPMLHVIMTPS